MTAAPTDEVVALRDRLRALGFSEEETRTAVRAQIEAPRLARPREILREAANLPCWRLPPSTPESYLKRNPELREMLKAERAELARVFGAGQRALIMVIRQPLRPPRSPAEPARR